MPNSSRLSLVSWEGHDELSNLNPKQPIIKHIIRSIDMIHFCNCCYFKKALLIFYDKNALFFRLDNSRIFKSDFIDHFILFILKR
jgi:hypothetical protein